MGRATSAQPVTDVSAARGVAQEVDVVCRGISRVAACLRALVARRRGRSPGESHSRDDGQRPQRLPSEGDAPRAPSPSSLPPSPSTPSSSPPSPPSLVLPLPPRSSGSPSEGAPPPSPAPGGHGDTGAAAADPGDAGRVMGAFADTASIPAAAGAGVAEGDPPLDITDLRAGRGSGLGGEVEASHAERPAPVPPASEAVRTRGDAGPGAGVRIEQEAAGGAGAGGVGATDAARAAYLDEGHLGQPEVSAGGIVDTTPW